MSLYIASVLIISSVLYYCRDFLPAGVGHQEQVAVNLEPQGSRDTEIIERLFSVWEQISVLLG